MPAAATDLIIAPGNPGTATSLAAPGYTIGGTSVTVGSTANWGTATGQIFAMDEVETVNGVQVRVDGTYNEYVGTVASGTSITNVSHITGSGTDRNYSAGATTRVYVPVSSNHLNKLHEALTASLDQDGTLKAGAVDVAAVLATDVVETAKIKDANVTTAKIADANVTSAKLAEAFFKGRRQANTTNSDISGYKVQHGWGFMLGSGAAGTTETVTLPTAFSSAAYIVVVTAIGYKAGSDPTSESDSTISASIIGSAKIIDSSSFTAGLHDTFTTMGATTRFLYSWIAIGPA